MPRRVREEEPVETDRIAGQPHPRETLALVGQDEALARAARAIRGGRPPQAWLIAGPAGIGKATFAYRVARYLLSYGATDKGPEDLGVPPKDPVVALVRAGAHPGLLVLKRGLNPDTGKLMTVLSVGEIRKLGPFFGMTAAAGGWRIAIIDTADEMNDQAANALLKILEEPPQRSMLILLAHAPAQLVATIRSRCQLLRLQPFSDDLLAREIAERVPTLAPGDRARLVALSGGSLGLALRLLEEDGLKLAADAEQLIERSASPDFAGLYALAERVAKIDKGLDSFGNTLAQTLADRILARAKQNAAYLDRWVELRAAIQETFARAAALHLEPKQTILSAARATARVARRGAL
ncbi:MAG TPA: DNA polymerase III subunit delta' [Rhizomicrobium sp.]|jgi:DNA polymerase-3 subunit delta'|nr:DNA polymerase III subunit delta' [Rhizomicrobium sp.]